MNIIIDAMGGDNAPAEIIKGAAAAVQETAPVPVIPPVPAKVPVPVTPPAPAKVPAPGIRPVPATAPAG